MDGGDIHSDIHMLDGRPFLAVSWLLSTGRRCQEVYVWEVTGNVCVGGDGKLLVDLGSNKLDLNRFMDNHQAFWAFFRLGYNLKNG